MTISALLLQDFDIEMAGTRKTLERIPDVHENPTYAPHEKSMGMGRLAMHVVTLPTFGHLIVTLPVLDPPNASWPPNMTYESREKMLSEFDRRASETRASLAAATDEQLAYPLPFSYAGKHLVTAPRSVLYRSLFFNHLIHHRAQLGVYLRLNDLPVPPLYGPTADDRMGF